VRSRRHVGRLLHALGRSDEAIAELDAMLETDPTSTALHASYGWFCFRERCKPARGLEIVRAAAERVATAARAGGAPDEALATAEAELRYLEGELLHLLDDDAGAANAMAMASALAPRSAFYLRQVRRFSATPRPAPVDPAP
jgi:tetratricopeptide (TPR) repeat protein